MWQPLSKTKGASGDISFSHHSTSESAGLTILITHVISSWAYVEATFGVVMAAFLKGDGVTAAAMYSTINGFRAQEDALKAAAKITLDSKSHDLFIDVLTSVRPMSTVRHQFAHWLWGSCKSLPGKMLLLQPQELWKFHAKARSKIYSPDANPVDFTKEDALDRSKIQVWSPEALMTATQEMDLCADLVSALACYLELPEDPSRDLLYQQMYSQPRMQTAKRKRQGQS